MHDEEDAFFSKLEADLENIKTREDLVEFVGLLVFGVSKRFFEDQAVIDYVEGLFGVLEGLESLCANNDFPCPDPPDWRLVGRVLKAAFAHS